MSTLLGQDPGFKTKHHELVFHKKHGPAVFLFSERLNISKIETEVALCISSGSLRSSRQSGVKHAQILLKEMQIMRENRERDVVLPTT